MAAAFAEICNRHPAKGVGSGERTAVRANKAYSDFRAATRLTCPPLFVDARQQLRRVRMTGKSAWARTVSCGDLLDRAYAQSPLALAGRKVEGI